LSGFLYDLSGNPSTFIRLDQAQQVQEINDDVPPTAKQVTLNLENGELVIDFRETIDLTTYGVNLSALVLTNTSSATDATSSATDATDATSSVLRLTGATTVVGESSFVTAVVTILTETQRAWAVLYSGTSGGDGGALLLQLEGNAFFDLSGNGNEAVSFTVVEHADSVPPVITAASINYETGHLAITFSESIKYQLTPRYPLSYFHLPRIYLSNGTSPPASFATTNDAVAVVDNDYVSLYGSQVVDYHGGAVLTLKVLEPTRVQGIEMSGTKGGDASYTKAMVSR